MSAASLDAAQRDDRTATNDFHIDDALTSFPGNSANNTPQESPDVADNCTRCLAQASHSFLYEQHKVCFLTCKNKNKNKNDIRYDRRVQVQRGLESWVYSLI